MVIYDHQNMSFSSNCETLITPIIISVLQCPTQDLDQPGSSVQIVQNKHLLLCRLLQDHCPLPHPPSSPAHRCPRNNLASLCEGTANNKTCNGYVFRIRWGNKKTINSDATFRHVTEILSTGTYYLTHIQIFIRLELIISLIFRY